MTTGLYASTLQVFALWFALSLTLSLPFSLGSSIATAQGKQVKIYIAPPEHIAQLDLAKLWFHSYQCVQSAVLEKENNQLTGNLNLITQESKECHISEFLERDHGEEPQFSAWRDFWIQNYISTIGTLKINFEIPPTHSDFLGLTEYENWKSETIESAVKRRPRQIWRSPNFRGHKVRVTRMQLREEECTSSASCLEHEIAISLGKDYVFAVYDHDGNLAQHAQFAGHKKKTPISCNGCHYSRKTRSLSKFFKEIN